MAPLRPVAILLAAGDSRRMGAPKPLLPLGDETVLERGVHLFQAAGVSDIRVVTGRTDHALKDHHPSLGAAWIHNEHFLSGMLSSVQRGIATIPPDRTCFFLLPVDIPLVRPRTVVTLLDAWRSSKAPGAILHPAFRAKRGHPPLISTRHIPGILAWEGPGGLRGFLDHHHAAAQDVPVIDEYILRDMDTPSDYESLTTGLSHRDIPSPDECTAMLNDPALFSEGTAAHCRQVAGLAVYLGDRLAAGHPELDRSRIRAAALVHDIGKGRPNHARAGATWLSESGFSGIADIVASHMDINFSEDGPLTEREVVYLADKLVDGDRLVSLTVRFEQKLLRHGHDPAARAAILKRRDAATAILNRIKKITGASFSSLLDGFVQELP